VVHMPIYNVNRLNLGPGGGGSGGGREGEGRESGRGGGGGLEFKVVQVTFFNTLF
jgi:uncharacterized spore protein YtfJ